MKLINTARKTTYGSSDCYVNPESIARCEVERKRVQRGFETRKNFLGVQQQYLVFDNEEVLRVWHVGGTDEHDYVDYDINLYHRLVEGGYL